MDLSTGTGVTASNTVPSYARYIAGRSHDRGLDASKEAPVLQPAGADQQLAGTAPSRTEVTAAPLGRPSELGTAADRSAGTAKSSVTEDNVNRLDLPPDDSGYGPSLWTAELGTPDGSRTEAVGAKCYIYSYLRGMLRKKCVMQLGLRSGSYDVVDFGTN